MANDELAFTGVHLFVRDMAASIAFYQRLGFSVDDGGHHAVISLPGGLTIALGTYELTRGYDPDWREPDGSTTNSLQFALASRPAVDDLYRDLTAAGYRGHLAPIDAFWGARYAVVDDPDGNLIGFHSPRDPERGGPPPV